MSRNKGLRKEDDLMNWLKSHGWEAWRSAGSHSPFDITAIKGNKIKIIQLKYGSERYLKYGNKAEEAAFGQWASGMYDVEFHFVKLKKNQRFGDVLSIS